MSANKQPDAPEIDFPTWPSLYRYAKRWINLWNNNRPIPDEITLTCTDADGGGKLWSAKPQAADAQTPVTFDTAGQDGTVVTIKIANATVSYNNQNQNQDV
jgi:hypothetical protein